MLNYVFTPIYSLQGEILTNDHKAKARNRKLEKTNLPASEAESASLWPGGKPT